jgi:hypothetical protein
MYNQHLKILLHKYGKGLFASIEIPANVPIMEFRGDICTDKNLPADNSLHLQIGKDIFLCPSGANDGVDFINHSCDPNCMVHVIGNRAILYSLYVIPKGAQLTFDYSTTSTDSKDSWQMNCNCGSSKCRQVISGHEYLSDEQKADYKQKGLLPLYIVEPNLIQKRW